MASAATYTPIATYTIPSNTAAYTFGSIPQTYTDLVLISLGQSTRAVVQDSLVANFNNDTTTSNYSALGVYGNGSSANSYSQPGSSGYYTIMGDLAGTSASSYFASSITHIQNYSNTTTYKTIIGRGNIAGGEAAAFVGSWHSTAAITSITLRTILSQNLVAGSTFTLYGILAA